MDKKMLNMPSLTDLIAMVIPKVPMRDVSLAYISCGLHLNQLISVIVSNDKTLSGFPLWKNQFMAMILKKMCTTYRTWYMFVFQNLIPIAILTITLISVNMTNMGEDLPSLHVSLDPFSDPVTVVSPSSSQNPYYNRYVEIMGGESREVGKTNNMTEEMLIRVRFCKKTFGQRISCIYIFLFGRLPKIPQRFECDLSWEQHSKRIQSRLGSTMNPTIRHL